MKNRIEYKGFYIDKTENGYRICRQKDTEKHTHLSNLNPSYRLIDNMYYQIKFQLVVDAIIWNHIFV